MVLHVEASIKLIQLGSIPFSGSFHGSINLFKCGAAFLIMLITYLSSPVVSQFRFPHPLVALLIRIPVFANSVHGFSFLHFLSCNLFFFLLRFHHVSTFVGGRFG